MATFQPTILRFDSIDSTNLEAMRQAREGAPEGFCIIAREQTRGRGRLDRTWQSPKDAGLYFSLILRPRLDKNVWSLITLMAALAVSDSLMKTCALPTDIKWPNDVCVRDRKICGILAETVETDSAAAAIVGIGINLTAEEFAMPKSAISVEAAVGRKIDPESIVPELLRSIGERYELLQTAEGREHTIREWCAHSSYAFDRLVNVSLDGENVTGRTRGLESDGALRLETEDRKIRIIRAGDVTAVRPTTGFDWSATVPFAE